MSEALEQFEQVRSEAGPVAMATLIAAKGTTPKKAGAKMWVGSDGRIVGSVTIGGCVDAKVIEAAESVLADGTASGHRVLSLSLGDDEAWEIGLTCGGSVEVAVERVEPANAEDPVSRAYRQVRSAIANGRSAVIGSRVAGPSDRLVAIEAEDGQVEVLGTLGTRELDAAALEAAVPELRAGSGSSVQTIRGPEGETRLFLELLRPTELLAVYGAGQIAIPLSAIAKVLDMRVVIVDGRERYATRERFPCADEIHIGMPSEIAARIPARRTTYVVLVAHDYKYELPVLRQVLRSDVGYIGMLGSRKRGIAVKDLLAAEGFGAAELDRIRTPIGLDIGARSAAEIALAIAAEIVAVRESARRERAPASARV